MLIGDADGSLGAVQDGVESRHKPPRTREIQRRRRGFQVFLALVLTASCAGVNGGGAANGTAQASSDSTASTGDFTAHFVPAGYRMVSADVQDPTTVKGLPGPPPAETVRTQFFSNSLDQSPKGKDAAAFEIVTIKDGSPLELMAEVGQVPGARQILVHGRAAVIASPNGNPELMTIAWIEPNDIVVKVTGRNIPEADLLDVAEGVEVH
jgi:hypothetical protein